VSPTSRVVALRLALLATLVAYMQVGSVRALVLNWADPPWAKAWEMYHGKGREQCRLDAYVLGEDARRLDDWFTLLGETRTSAPKITSDKERDRIGRKLCKALPGTSIAVVTTCGKTGGWKRPSPTRDLDVCDPAAKLRRAREKLIETEKGP